MRNSHAATTHGMPEINPGLRSQRRTHDMGNSGMLKDVAY